MGFRNIIHQKLSCDAGFVWMETSPQKEDVCTLEQGSEKSGTAIRELYKTDKVF